jgi:hypothetical protein
MWHLLDPHWIADRLGIEPWQVFVLPIGTVVILTLVSMSRKRDRSFTYVDGVRPRSQSGPLPFLIGFAGGTGIALAMTGFWRELVPVLRSLG